MLEFLQTTTAQVVIWIAVLLVLCAIGAYVVLWFRNGQDNNQPSSSEWLSHFREIHDQGGISHTEFREIKSVLGARLQEELDSNRMERED